MRLIVLIVCLCISACQPFFVFGTHRFGTYQHLKTAEEYSRQGNYQKAISAYKAHIQSRLSVKERPEWENPYFYYLIIGDLQLSQGEVSEALTAYETAEKNDVDVHLVSDRYRYVASWHEKNGDLQEAFDVLMNYRDRDFLLMDMMLDRLAREMVRLEDLKANN